jgi:hypothetical protein
MSLTMVVKGEVVQSSISPFVAFDDNGAVRFKVQGVRVDGELYVGQLGWARVVEPDAPLEIKKGAEVLSGLQHGLDVAKVRGFNVSHLINADDDHNPLWQAIIRLVPGCQIVALGELDIEQAKGRPRFMLRELRVISWPDGAGPAARLSLPTVVGGVGGASYNSSAKAGK